MSVRAGAAPLWWLGVVAAGVGVLVPGLTGRRIGVMAGGALFLIALAAVFAVRRGRYAASARAATRAARHDVLQDRRVTLANWRRAHRWWLAGAFLAAVCTSFVLPTAGGLLLAGAGAGLWAKAAWLGRLERDADALLWVPVDRAAKGLAGRPVGPYRRTGIAAGDAAPGGARRPARV
ncbi:hypothetical protein [Streptomyces indicus]|uniref:Integral membrane protein n=1 Tax=Streptomyces indicus TaxID=417292 RepID=A0A1G9I1J9_9ACTN|nr:hypothetical protein [Streptomyces indicus]SDL18916.1 hypothetical protein SAMN05421806_12126 [Streptomyces indicus]